MKNFKILLENIQGLLLEANYKQFMLIWQELFFQRNKIANYDAMKDNDSLKIELNDYIKKQQQFIDTQFQGLDDNSQLWIGKIIQTKRQKYPEDLSKLIGMMKNYTQLKKVPSNHEDALTSEEKNLGSKSFEDIEKIIADKMDKGLITNYANNKIIKQNSDWKIIELTDYEESAKLIKNNQNSWCVKEKPNWDEYGAPYYAFYKNDKPYALFNQNSSQLKNKSDKIFQSLEPEFSDMLDWLFLDYLKIKKFKKSEDNQQDLIVLVANNYKKYQKHFNKEMIKDYAISSKNLKLHYQILDSNPSKMTDQDRLHKACVFGDTEQAKELLNKGIDPHVPHKHFILSSFLGALKENNFDIVKEIISRLDDINKQFQEDELYSPTYPLLTFAVKYKNIKAVKLLLEHPDIDVNLHGKLYIDTPLSMAVSEGEYKIVELLLNHKNIDPNMLCAGWSPILRSVVNIYEGDNYKKIFNLLLKHPKIDVNQVYINNSMVANYIRGDKFTLIMECIMEYKFECLKELLKRDDIDLNIVVDVNSSNSKKTALTTLLEFSAMPVDVDIFEKILTHKNMDVKKHIPFINIGRFLRNYEDNPTVIKYVFDTIKFTGQDFSDSFYYCCESISENGFYYLLKNFENIIDFNKKHGEQNKTALFALADNISNIDYYYKTKLVSTTKMFNHLISISKVDVNDTDRLGRTVLMYLVLEGTYEVVKNFLEKRKDFKLINHRSRLGETVMTFAYQKKSAETNKIVALLKEHGAKE